MNHSAPQVIALSSAMPRKISMHGRMVDTSIVRDPIPGPLRIVSDGPESNQTAVHSEHLLAFNAEHYDYWTQQLGVDRAAWQWAWWGENLTITGIDEESLRVGDIVRVGSAVLRVTSPRIPCFKVAWRIGQPDSVLVKMMQSGKVGIHLEVLSTGEIAVGDRMAIEPADAGNVTLAELSRLLLSLSPDDLPRLRKTLALPALGLKANHSVRQRITLIEDRERLRVGRWRGWRPMTISAVRDEAEGIRSFYLTPQDGEPLAPPAAGQFLTIKTAHGDGPELVRPWTISDVDLDKRHYRLSIKHIDGGAASQRMHRQMAVGDSVLARPPAGQFVINRSSFLRIGLVSGGIGLTPMLAMLKAHNERGDNAPPLIWVQVLKNSRHHALREETEQALGQVRRLQRHIFYTQPLPGDKQGVDFDHAGRPTPELLAQILGAPYTMAPFAREVTLPGKETEFYICGPGELEQMVRSTLAPLGVKPGYIHSEAFVTPAGQPGTGGSVEQAQVRFVRSGITAQWHADDGLSLLDLAESVGLEPVFACRTGTCHSCSCKLVAGEVTYHPVPPVAPEAGQALICCARPAGATVEIDL